MDNSKPEFNTTKILTMFRADITRPTLNSMEEKGLIPKAERINRGKVPARMWTVKDLPSIGEKIGFLPKLKTPHVVSIFSLKGGTNKTSFAFQFARTLALHNIRTLVIGMDAQQSITQTIRGPSYVMPETEEDDTLGLFHVLTEEATLDEVIEDTDLDTLKFIPETIELSVLSKWLGSKDYPTKRIHRQVIRPLLKNDRFDMIIFDCNPSWDNMVSNALDSSDILLSPLGCDINSLKATAVFTALLEEFVDGKEEDFLVNKIVPTMAENNKLSQTVLAKYRLNYTDICAFNSIRRSIVVQESNVQGKSLFETSPKNPVTNDYYQVLAEIWEAIQLEEEEIFQEQELIMQEKIKINNENQPRA